MQKGRRKMFLHPNHSADYRNWAHCCLKIKKLYKEINLCKDRKFIDPAAYFFIKANGKEAYFKSKESMIPELMRKVSRYEALRDKLAAKLIDPEKHLLQVEDLLNMIGNVIDIAPRHSKEKKYLVLYDCSCDGTEVMGRDAYELLAHGYGKAEDQTFVSEK